MSRRFSSPRLLAVALMGAGLAGCTTPRLQPTPSLAIAEARANAVLKKPANCPALDAPARVGFGFAVSDLDELSGLELNSLTGALLCRAPTPVLIVGEADGHGTPGERETLARKRAEAVRGDLVRRGVAAGRLQMQVQGDAPASDATRLVVLAEGRRW